MSDDPPHPQHGYSIRTFAPPRLHAVREKKKSSRAQLHQVILRTIWHCVADLLVWHSTHAGFDESVSRCVGSTRQY